VIDSVFVREDYPHEIRTGGPDPKESSQVSSTISSSAILAYEAAIANLILVTVVEATPAIGRPPSRSFVASALVGSVRRDLVAADAHRLSTFGLLARQGLDQIQEWLDALLARGLLEIVQGRRGLVCTAAGRTHIDGGADDAGVGPPRGLLRGAVDANDLDLAVRAGLVEALRRYRSEQAGAEDVPEYRLFAESTLREVAVKLPRDERELEALPGLGAKRIAAHGIELLRIVAEHAPIVERLRRSRPTPGDLMDEPLTAVRF
jgi:ATP-dependent DNA helicase RecQ